LDANGAKRIHTSSETGSVGANADTKLESLGAPGAPPNVHRYWLVNNGFWGLVSSAVGRLSTIAAGEGSRTPPIGSRSGQHRGPSVVGTAHPQSFATGRGGFAWADIGKNSEAPSIWALVTKWPAKKAATSATRVRSVTSRLDLLHAHPLTAEFVIPVRLTTRRRSGLTWTMPRSTVAYFDSAPCSGRCGRTASEFWSRVQSSRRPGGRPAGMYLPTVWCRVSNGTGCQGARAGHGRRTPGSGAADIKTVGRRGRRRGRGTTCGR